MSPRGRATAPARDANGAAAPAALPRRAPKAAIDIAIAQLEESVRNGTVDEEAGRRVVDQLKRSRPDGAGELAGGRREHILTSLTDRQQMSAKAAKQHLENVIGLLNLFERVTLSQHGEGGQASWTIRVSPATASK